MQSTEKKRVNMPKQIFHNFRVAVLILTAITSISCNKGGGGDGGGGGYNPNGNLIQPQVDVSGALGLLVVDNSSSTSTQSVAAIHNKTAALLGAPLIHPENIHSTSNELTKQASEDGTGSLKKTDSSGNVTAAISVPGATSNQQGGPQSLPKISTIAVSPVGEIFLHFENPFRHKAPDATTTQGNPWSDGSYCQLFRVKGGTVDALKTTPPTGENLECLDYLHFVNNWQAQRNSVFQFDAEGNVYYPGQIPNSPKMVVYKWNRATGALTEMINSNICVQDFLVTKLGGLFYTGTSSCNGGGSSGGGFFRYISSAGALTEIARDWWNFIYEPITTGTTDKAVFFGPDPTSASTASWNSACLFNFDPNGGSTTADRTKNVITCGSNIWDWVQMRRTEDIATYGQGYVNNQTASTAYKTEFASRCPSSGQVFAGGGSQISAIKQDSTGQIYVIGNVRKKNAGTLTCDLEVRGPHCKIGGMPNTTYATESACTTTGGGAWIDAGRCGNGSLATSADCFTGSSTWYRDTTWYSGVTTSICTAAGEISAANWWNADSGISFQTAAGPGTHVMKFKINNFNCSPPTSSNNGDQWTSEYRGLAKVNLASKTLSLVSTTTEQAINLWLVNDKVYYSSYDSVSGQYRMNYYDGSTSNVMASNFEVYHLNTSGLSDGSLYFDGLDFSNNSYTFGTILSAAPYTKTQRTGLTGTLKTIVILP
jgi:hypothetical protein